MLSVYLQIFLLFFLEFIVLPFGASHYEIPRVIVAEGVISLLLLSKILNKNFSFKKISKEKAVVCCIFFVLSLFHLLFSGTSISFFGNVFRLQGTFLLWNLLIIYLFSEKIITKNIGLLAAFALFGQLFFALTIGFNSNSRAVGTLGEPNSLAAVAIFLWPFVYFFNKKSILKITAIFCVAIVILITKSRSGMFALIFQLVFLSLDMKLNFPLKISFLITSLLIFMSYIFPFFELFPYESRAEVWISSLLSGFSHPIFGTGFGNMEIAIRNSAISQGLSIQRNYVDSAHNIFLDFFVQGGFIGLLTLLFAIFSFIRRALQKRAIINLVLFVGLITSMSFNPVSVYIIIAFWWLIGQE